MNIPTSFRMFGETITVRYAPEAFIEQADCIGFASYRTNEIKLRPSTATMPLKRDQIEQVFCHELMHFIMHKAEDMVSNLETPLRSQEGFIDFAASLLHQALTTMEGELET